jgi:hypothetical protein
MLELDSGQTLPLSKLQQVVDAATLTTNPMQKGIFPVTTNTKSLFGINL